MKVKQLKQLLERCNDDNEVVIMSDRGHVAIGQSHSVGIMSVGDGFDWDIGTTQISPSEKLSVVDGTTDVAIKYFRESIDFYMMAEAGVFNRNQVSRELKRFLETAIEELEGK